MAKQSTRAESAEQSVADILTRPYMRAVIPEDDGSFRAEILEFPGCIALGDTPEEALELLLEVAESWLLSKLATGQSIPEPLECSGYSGKTVVRMPRSLHRKAAYAAERDGVSLNQFIVNSIAQQVGANSERSRHEQQPAVPGTLHVVSGGALIGVFNQPQFLNFSAEAETASRLTASLREVEERQNA